MVTDHRGQLLPARRIPELHGSVRRPRSQYLAIGRERHTPYTGPMSAEGKPLLSVRRAPNFHHTILLARGGSQQRAVRGKRNRKQMTVPCTPAQALVLVALLPEEIPVKAAQVLLIELGPLAFQQLQ